MEEGWGPLRAPSCLYQIAALVLVGLALRIDLMTLLLAPLLLWFMVHHRWGVSAALLGIAWRALVVLGVFVLAYLPDWRGSETFLAITNGLHLFDFANSPLSLAVGPVRSLFAFVAQRAHFPLLMQPTTAADMTVMATSFFLFALLYVREMGRVRTRIRAYSEDVEAAGDVQLPRPHPVGTGGRVGWMWGPCACPRPITIRPGSDDSEQDVSQQEDEETGRVFSEEAEGDEDRHKAPSHPRVRPLSLQGGNGGNSIVRLLPYETLFTSLAVVIVGYIVLGVTVFLPGYIVWGVWVVALRRSDALSVGVVLLSCSMLLYYVWQQVALTSTSFVLPLCVFGIPLVYLLVQYWRPWMHTGRRERKQVLSDR